MTDTELDLLKLENQLCFPLYAASREVIKLYRPHLDKLNLTYTQYVTMLVLWENGSCNVKELGEKLYLDSGTLTPLLKGLEKKGYVARKREARDQRYLAVELTPLGKKLKEQAIAVPKEMAKCVLLNQEESLQLYNLIYKLLGAKK